MANVNGGNSGSSIPYSGMEIKLLFDFTGEAIGKANNILFGKHAQIQFETVGHCRIMKFIEGHDTWWIIDVSVCVLSSSSRSDILNYLKEISYFVRHSYLYKNKVPNPSFLQQASRIRALLADSNIVGSLGDFDEL